MSPRDPALTESYDYVLPEERIATEPVEPRDSSRLFVIDRYRDTITHSVFSEIESFIPDDAALLFNNTKVIKARLLGHKETGGKTELLLHRAVPGGLFEAQIRGRVHEGSKLLFDQNLSAEVVRIHEDGMRSIRFYQDSQPLAPELLYPVLESIGHVPLPPYIKREDRESDTTRYQSVFAEKDGAVAAPTASLHFTPELLRCVTAAHAHAYVTLHVSGGTFLPVETDAILSHPMHSEWFAIPDSTQTLIDSDTPLLCVGTTAARTVEWYARTRMPEGECNLFLHPGNTPRRVNHLLTNFHLPKSTLIMLVAAFLGLEKTMDIYARAIEKNYRFYSYGDAMLIL